MAVVLLAAAALVWYARARRTAVRSIVSPHARDSDHELLHAACGGSATARVNPVGLAAAAQSGGTGGSDI